MLTILERAIPLVQKARRYMTDLDETFGATTYIKDLEDTLNILNASKESKIVLDASGNSFTRFYLTWFETDGTWERPVVMGYLRWNEPVKDVAGKWEIIT